MIVAFSVAPSTENPNGSVRGAGAEAVKIIRELGRPHRTSSMFTNIRRLGQGKNLTLAAGL